MLIYNIYYRSLKDLNYNIFSLALHNNYIHDIIPSTTLYGTNLF
jgi:hypothetical protein